MGDWEKYGKGNSNLPFLVFNTFRFVVSMAQDLAFVLNKHHST